MTDEGPVTSADEDAWIDIARRMRAEIEKQIPLVGAMSPTNLKIFVEAVRDIRWLNQNALTFDKDVEIEMAKMPYD